MSPLPLNLLAVIPGAGTQGRSTLHAFFSDHREHNDWFRPHTDLIAYVCRSARKYGEPQ
jgi:hypothetical protein